jgi:hypothetical protein
LWQYSFYHALYDCYSHLLWLPEEIDVMAWRDYADVAIAAEKISRDLKAFADSSLECLEIQSYDIANHLRYHLQNICFRISHRRQRQLDFALEEILGYAEDLNTSVEERTRRQVAYDQLRMDVSRHREEIAAI